MKTNLAWIIRLGILFVNFPMFSYAQVASSSFVGLDAIDNPAGLTTSQDQIRVQAQSNSGTGVFNENIVERELYKISSSQVMLTLKKSAFGMQLKMRPSSKREIDEVVEYSRVSSTAEQSALQMSLAYRIGDIVNVGLGYLSDTEKFGSYQTSRIALKMGGVFALPMGLHFGLLADLATYKEPAQETRSRVEPALGVGVVVQEYLFQLRVEGSLAKAPEVFQQTAGSSGPGYLRGWNQTRISVEGAYNFSAANLAIGVDQRSRTYVALETGNDEKETENTIYVGAVFLSNRFGVFVGQTKLANTLAKHEHSSTSNRLTLSVIF